MDIREILKNKNLTPKNRSIAQYVIDHSDEIAFMSVTEVANKLKVSDATVIRFARNIGYKGFSDMKSHLQNDIVRSLQESYAYVDSPGDKLKIAVKDKNTSLVDLVLDNSIENIEICMKKNLERTYCEASKIIADSRSTTVIGFWGCAPLAHYLWIKLGYLCDNINLISQGEPEYFSRLFGLGEEDVVVLFTSGRYPKHASVAARLAKRNCCKIVLISDKEMCPLQGYADYLFVAPNVGVSFSNAMAPVLVCEILCNTVTELTWKKRKGFHQYMESLLRDIDYYEDKTFSSREV